MSKRRTRIPESLQIEIAQFYLDNPDCSLEAAGRKFNASRNQVRYAIDKYKRNEFDEAVKEEREADIERSKIKVLQDLKAKGALRLVDQLIVDVIAECEVKEDLPISEKMDYVNKLTNAMKRVQSLQLVEALKKPDAQKVIKLCKKIKPGLTDSEIMILWEQVLTEK